MSKTLTGEEAIAKAKRMREANNHTGEVIFTSDGQAFFNHDAALNHARRKEEEGIWIVNPDDTMQVMNFKQFEELLTERAVATRPQEEQKQIAKEAAKAETAAAPVNEFMTRFNAVEVEHKLQLIDEAEDETDIASISGQSEEVMAAVTAKLALLRQKAGDDAARQSYISAFRKSNVGDRIAIVTECNSVEVLNELKAGENSKNVIAAIEARIAVLQTPAEETINANDTTGTTSTEGGKPGDQEDGTGTTEGGTGEVKNEGDVNGEATSS